MFKPQCQKEREGANIEIAGDSIKNEINVVLRSFVVKKNQKVVC
jgi:hypothetical protein